FIGGPYYSSDTKFGIGLVAAGLYRCNGADSLLPKSNVSLYLKATTSMFFQLGIEGTNIFSGDRRLHYDVNFSSVKSKFWGIGYDMNVDDAHESSYNYLASSAAADYTWCVANGLYLGPLVDFEYVNGRKFKKPELWKDEDKRTFNLGVGFTLVYDTRDNLNNAYRGIYLRFNQQFNPRFLLNRNAFSMSELTFSAYRQVWKGGVIAGDFHTRLTYGNTPWGLLSTFGGSDDMRGYYEGRYRDKCSITACVELRQHIWRRNGVVAWVGAGTVFDRFSSMRWSKVLPNYGIGYRWEFKQRMNVRLDLGFGKHCKGFIFSINEAF
ncbi:MAG: outer membrane protein assembly factor, partial [Muribaculaceae bacterium]|nr:outer membrane protein assembly factor [Muribaculaceae bacterium]